MVVTPVALSVTVMLSVEKYKIEYQSFCFSCFDITFEDASLCSLRDELHKRDIIFNT